MKHLTRRTFAAGALAASAAAPASAQLAPYTATASIGVVAPLSGPARRAGEQLGDGVRAALDEANRVRASFDKVYAMRTFDDQNDVATAMVNSQFAIADGSIIGVIGHLGGAPTDNAMRSYRDSYMPVIVPASTLDAITGHGYRNVFRLPTRDTSEGDLFAQYVAQTAKPKSVHVLVQDGDYGADVARAFVQRMQSSGADTKLTIFPWEKFDAGKVAANILATKPDYLFLAGAVTDMGPIVPALRSAGYTGAMGASQGFFDLATLGTYATAVEGMTVSTSMPPLALAPQAFRTKSEFELRYGAFTPVAAFGYAAAQIFTQAIKRSGAGSRNALLTSMQRSGTYDTLVGSFTFTLTGDPSDPNLYFYEVRGGNWRYARSAHPSSFLIK